MRTLILTSCLDLYEYDNNGEKVVHNFGNFNKILDNIKAEVKKCDNFLFVARGIDDERTFSYYRNTCESFEMTLPFKNYDILNYETACNAKELIENADLIFLCGGHLPTQNKFFNDINLATHIQNTNALIIGGSAGSMNCASVVYCPPEVEGESEDKNFNRYLKGLSLTEINILPHYDEFIDYVLDGKSYINDIIMPYSNKTPVIALNNGSYILIKNNENIIFGESYAIYDNKIEKLCSDDETYKFQSWEKFKN